MSPSLPPPPSSLHTLLTLPAPTIAAALRADQALIARHQPPSLLALHIPRHLTDAVASALWDESTDGPRPPLPVLRIRYYGVIDGLKSAIASAPSPQQQQQGGNMMMVAATIPPTEDFDAAARVLQYLLRVPATRVRDDTPLRDVLVAVRTQGAVGAGGRAAYAAAPSMGTERGKKEKKRRAAAAAAGRCYMCHYTNTAPHAVYKSLCVLCGSFNLSESRLSTAGTLDLRGRTALVTGGRVNLGYAVATRLLRCGAGVIVSTRYPLDAERRLRAEPDFGAWGPRVRVVGADFRHMRDAGALVAEVKRVLGTWGGSTTNGRGPVLDVLVNNAAQTLTDSREKESAAVGREMALLDLCAGGGGEEGGPGSSIIGGEYRAKIRGGARENRILVGGPPREAEAAESYHDEKTTTTTTAAAVEEEEEEEEISPPRQEIATNCKPPQSSWTQRISEIPYQDIGDVLAINSFVPLLLIRELLPLMGRTRTHTRTTDRHQHQHQQPAGYIINVSSREGLSEASPAASIKGGHHVHTNMSKAALNMITETEAAAAWRDRRVAINSVDPGFMSAADGSECPIGWEDGAARVLWCVAKGEVEREPVWGRFLKHFGAAEAVVRGV